MCRKFFYLISLVLVLTLVSNAFAWDFAAEVTNWTGAVSRDWTDQANWNPRVPDPSPVLPGSSNTRINPDAYTGGAYNPLIGPGQVASTSEFDTWGPEFGAILDIEGGSYSGPAFIGLNAYSADPALTSEINLGRNGTEGDIAIINFLLGDSWWGSGPYVVFNQWSGTAIASDWIWLGGKMNLYGGYTMATGGMNVDAPNSNQTKIDVFGGLYGPEITTLNIVAPDGVNSGGMLSLPVGLYNDGTIAGWIANGYLVANGGAAGYQIAFDLESEIDRVVLTSVPEPATIALLGLGGLALIRRKRS